MSQLPSLKIREIQDAIEGIAASSERVFASAKACKEMRELSALTLADIGAKTDVFLEPISVDAVDRRRLKQEIVDRVGHVLCRRLQVDVTEKELVQLQKLVASLSAPLSPLLSRSDLIEQASTSLRTGAGDLAEDLGSLAMFLKISDFFANTLRVSSREDWIGLRDTLKALLRGLAQSLRALKRAYRLCYGGPYQNMLWRVLGELRNLNTKLSRLKLVGRIWAGQMARSNGSAARAARDAHRRGIMARLQEIGAALRAMKAIRNTMQAGTAAIDAALCDLQAQYRSLVAQRHLSRSPRCQMTGS